LPVAEAEHALLQDRILAVPERQAQAEPLLVVAEPADGILAPAIGAAGGMLKREIAPGISAGAVVLAHRAPLSLAHIGAPFAPGHTASIRLFQTFLFSVRGRRHGLILRCASAGLPPMTCIYAWTATFLRLGKKV